MASLRVNRHLLLPAVPLIGHLAIPWHRSLGVEPQAWPPEKRDVELAQPWRQPPHPVLTPRSDRISDRHADGRQLPRRP